MRLRSRSPRSQRVRPTTALALVTLCLAAAAAQASTPAQVTQALPEAAPAPTAAGEAGHSLPQGPAVATPVQAMAPAVVPVSFTPTGTGVPANLLDAYRSAEALPARTHGGCNLRWYHLAGIGRIESGHARGGQAGPTGETSPQILGPVLAGGPGIAAIRDTDRGALDGDSVWDRAVGPMQFIPSTWAFYRTDGNADGTTSPHNIYDAAAAAGRYLCSGGMNLSNPSDLGAAVYRYNHSTEYVSTVLMWMHRYSAGATPLPPQPPTPSRAEVSLNPPPPPDIPIPEPVPTPKPDPMSIPAPPKPLPEPAPVSPPDCDSLIDALPIIGGNVITSCPKPVDAPAGEPVTEPVSEPIGGPAADPVDEPATEPVGRPAGEPVGGPVEEPATEPVIEPVIKSTEAPTPPQPDPAQP